MSRMLGYANGIATTRSHFGQVSSTYAMDDVRCFGNETSILACPHSDVDDCGSSEAAGVICDQVPGSTTDYYDYTNYYYYGPGR